MIDTEQSISDSSDNVDQRDDRRIDILLLAFAKTVNDDDRNEIPLTLSTPAGVVTGTLISRARWLREMSKTVSGDGQQFVAHLVDAFEEIAKEEGNMPDWSNFAHLRNAQFVTGANLLPGSDGVHWRCFLDEVIGWSLGSIQS